MNLAGNTTPGPRETNEDSHYYCDMTQVGRFAQNIEAFIMVSDGMGGHEAGDVASSLAVQAAKNYIGDLSRMGAVTGGLDLDTGLALSEIVRNAQALIAEESRLRNNASMGATFVAAFISPEKAWIGHIGDSRAYLIRDGIARQLTTDHSAVGRLLREGVITEEEAQEHPDRNRIEKALGFTFDDPEITEVNLYPNDCVMLCSDGVSTVLNVADIVNCYTKARTIDDAANSIIGQALRKHTDDNSTVVLCELKESKKHNPDTLSGATSGTVIARHAKQPTKCVGKHSINPSNQLNPKTIASCAVALVLGAAIGFFAPAVLDDQNKQQESGNAAMQADSDKTSTFSKYVTTEPTTLKFVDAEGTAQNFDDEDLGGLSESPKIESGKSITVKADINSYNRENNYNTLDDSLLKELLNDLNTGSANTNSELAKLLGENTYKNFVNELRNSGIKSDNIKKLVVNANSLRPGFSSEQ